MILRVPDYYEEFACIAERCKGSCCAGWEIDIDEPTREYYIGVPGAIGDRMRERLYQGEDGGFRFRLSEDGRCPFLNADNLCDIILALGQEALSEVCTDFPRFSLSYGHVMQRVLSISCEEVGRILFLRREPVTFVEHEMDCLADWEDEEADEAYIAFLEAVQKRAIGILQDRSRTLDLRVEEFLALCEAAQDIVNHYGDDAGENAGLGQVPRADVRELCEYDLRLVRQWRGLGSERERYMAFDERWGILEALEELGVKWVIAKRHVREVMTEERCALLLPAYVQSDSCDEVAYEQLLVYFVFRYLMQAVYSYDLLSYGRMAVSFTLMIRDMDVVRWSENGESLSLEDRIENAHIFSREVEHSEENFEQIREELTFLA